MSLRGLGAAVLLAGLALTSCGGAAPRTTGARAQGPSAVHYDVHVAGTDPWVLDVSVTLTGGADRLLANAPGGVVSVDVQDPGARGLRGAARDGAQWPIRCEGTCVARYRLDLSAIADSGATKEALRAGPDLVAPASTWLLRPEPLSVDVPVTIRVHPAPGVRFASGLRQRADGTIDLQAQELRYAGYSAFGAFESLRVDATEGVVDVAVLGGGERFDSQLIEGWVRAAASSLDHVYGRFPVKRAQVFVVPTAGSSRVDLGRTLPSGGASTLIFVGEDASERDFSEDWILTHELFHLGVPSFWREGRWLDEGLATYYEPVIRTRAGQLSDHDLWSEFATQMPLGLPSAVGDPCLARDPDHRRIYWGGALFVLLADLEIRRRTGGARSLDDGLRAVLDRGGDATKVWTVADFIAVIDEAVSVPVMHDLHARASAEGTGACRSPLSLIEVCPERGDRELAGLLHDLGIGAPETGAIAIADDARWSELRRAIERPPAPRDRGRDSARLPIGRALR